VIGPGGQRAFAFLIYENGCSTISADRITEYESDPSKEYSHPITANGRDAERVVSQTPPKKSSPWKDFQMMSLRTYPSGLEISIDIEGHSFEPFFMDFEEANPQRYLTRIINRIIPSKPAVKTVSEVMATEDLRLADKRGWQFATLGLTSSGDPAFALTDRAGGVQMAWAQRRGHALMEPDWWDIALYQKGRLRVSVEMKPGKEPDLAITDSLGRSLGFDIEGNKLIMSESGRREFPELWGLNFEPRRPIALYDRGIQIWKAPAVPGQPAGPPTILPSKIEVLDAVMSPSERRIVASPKGDMRPYYRVGGRMRNNSAVEIAKVDLRITIRNGRSRTEVDGADISLSITLPPGATRAFDQEIQVLPPPNWTSDWTCEAVSATPK
jgi:hypothetical protein